MELVAYTFIYFLTGIFLVVPGIIKEKYFFIFWLIIAIGLSFVIRSSLGETYSADLDGYIVSMASDNVIPYFLREPIFWFGIRFLYDFVGDGAAVFIVLDFILFIFLYKGFSLNRTMFSPGVRSVDVRYIYFAVFLFFPYVLGMHNMYRQLLASTIIMCAIGYIGNNKSVKGFTLSLVAVLIHNASSIFFPLLFLVMDRRRYKLFSVGLLIAVLFLIGFRSNFSSDFISRGIGNIVGDNIAYLYLLALSIIVIVVIAIETISRDKKYNSFIGYLTIMIVLYGFCTFTLVSGQAQRVFFYVLALMFPVLACYCEERIKPKIVVRLVYFHLSLLPLLFLYNTTIDVAVT